MHMRLKFRDKKYLVTKCLASRLQRDPPFVGREASHEWFPREGTK